MEQTRIYRFTIMTKTVIFTHLTTHVVERENEVDERLAAGRVAERAHGAHRQLLGGGLGLHLLVQALGQLLVQARELACWVSLCVVCLNQNTLRQLPYRKRRGWALPLKK